MMTVEPEWDGLAEIRELARKVAAQDTTVLLLGESGTGKGLIADYIHSKSKRAAKPFVKVNTGGLLGTLIDSELFGHSRGAFTNAIADRKGRFVLAHTGTIFLDEIGDLEPSLQVKLLRVLQDGEIEPLGGKSEKVNVRVIAATNRDLQSAMRAGSFREDLYYRLAVFSIRMPALRDRGREAITKIAESTLVDICQKHGRPPMSLSNGVLDVLCGYRWPGNIRELQNVVERAVVVAEGTEITIADIRDIDAHAAVPPPETQDSLEQIANRLGNFKLRDAVFKRTVLALAGSLVARVRTAGDDAAVRREVIRRAIRMSVERDALLLDEFSYAFSAFIVWESSHILDEPITTAFLKRRYSKTFNKTKAQLGPLYAKIRSLVVDPSSDPPFD